MQANGLPEKNARSLLGKWRKQLGDNEVITLISEASSEAVSEPVAWIEAAVRNRPDSDAWENDYYKTVL